MIKKKLSKFRIEMNFLNKVDNICKKQKQNVLQPQKTYS